MQKQKIIYNSPIDAIISLTKRLNTFETQYGMVSEDFYDKFKKGLLDDSIDFVEWSNDYQHFMALRVEIEKHINHVA